MIYKTYREFRSAIEEKTGKIPPKVWSIFTDLSCMNMHPAFDGNDFKNAVFAIRRLKENMKKERKKPMKRN